MCGIAGIISQSIAPDTALAATRRMQSHLVHRGPDDAGLWQSLEGEAIFAHQRLSILDLSSAGHQPMSTPDGRLTIVFNGEIYNFRELRTNLEQDGVTFTTQTDTEVILRLYEKHGSACVGKLRGMFAFAIWNTATRHLLLARDPLGIKPLYIHRTREVLAFASELRALTHSGLFTPTLCTPAVQRYLETGSVPEPLTLVQQATQLEAGHLLEWQPGKDSTQRPYWQLDFTCAQPAPHATLVERTRQALIDSVRSHFVSDVPVGVFLSGGIDSTALLALAGVTGHTGIRAFSIAVDDPAADESPIARRTAQHFQADYHERRLDAREAQGLFSRFLDQLDQPSIDGLNTYTVSALARDQGMKVVLSGLGGDELFGGYSSFQRIPKMRHLHRWIHRLPGAARLTASLLEKCSPEPAHKRLAAFLRTPGTTQDAYRSLRGIFTPEDAAQVTHWITGQPPPPEPQPAPAATVPAPSLNLISELELTRYMRNQLLRDSDVMSMANGLELRVPFVDKALVETLATVPFTHRLQPGKRLLTEAVPEVPEWVVNQKKRGFLFPYQQWLGSEWGTVFADAVRDCPVPTSKWYQRWSIFVLKHCMARLRITP